MPRSAEKATRAGRQPERAAVRKSSLLGNEIGSAGLSPVIASRRSAVSSTERPIGPLTLSRRSIFEPGSLATRPGLGLSPSRRTPYDRQALLIRAYDLLERRFEEVAEIKSIDMGAPIARTRGAKAAAMRMVQFFAAMALSVKGETLPNGLPGSVITLTLRAPAGVVGGIIPWNGSLTSLWWIVGAVIATGCTTVLKPAAEASLSVLYLVDLLQGIGLPKGVVNVVTGHCAEAGDALARHPDVDRIAFTGSTETGRRIIDASKTTIKRLQLELGGKSPDIVFADADFDRAVPGAAMGIFANSGQVCFAGSRILVERSIAEDFTGRLADFLKTLRLGRSLDPEAQLGPVISDKQRELGPVLCRDRSDGGRTAGGGWGARRGRPIGRLLRRAHRLRQCGHGHAASVVLWAPVSNPLGTYAGLVTQEVVDRALAAPADEKITAPLSWGGETTLKARFFQELVITSPAAALSGYLGPVAVIVGTKETIVAPQPAAGQVLLNYHDGEETLVEVDSDHDWNALKTFDTVDTALLPATVDWLKGHF